MIKFLFFAQLADDVGSATICFDHIEGQSVQDYLQQLVDDRPNLKASLLDDDSPLVSVNQKLASRADTLSDGDEVGMLPPFSGG